MFGGPEKARVTGVWGWGREEIAEKGQVRSGWNTLLTLGFGVMKSHLEDVF